MTTYFRLGSLAAFATVYIFGAQQALAQYGQVNAGYELFQTEAGTQFDGETFNGVKLGNYNFGNGAVNTGATDTIIQRLGNASVAANGQSVTVNTQMDALQLVSGSEFNYGGNGLAYYYITLATNTASMGTQTITFNTPTSGTFSATMDLNYVIDMGSLNGPEVGSGSVMLTSDSVNWGIVPPTGADKINGVNYLLNGTNTNNDFWLNPPVWTAPQNWVVDEGTAPVPEPFTMGLGIAAVGLAARRRLRRA